MGIRVSVLSGDVVFCVAQKTPFEIGMILLSLDVYSRWCIFR
jgi:hypothetical protein